MLVRALLAIGLVALAPRPASADDDDSAAGDDDSASADDDDSSPPATNAPRPIRWFALPNVGYDTDDGFGFGARLEIQRVEAGVEPYRAWFMVQAWLTLRGYHDHRVEIDLPGLGPRGRTRMTVLAAYRQWLNDGYWGIGNSALRERPWVGAFERDDPRRRRYRYYLIQPFAHMGLRWGIGDTPMALFGSLGVQWSRIATYPDSLLEEQRPAGMDGGFTAQVGLGFLVDTRLPEVAPDRGVLLEVSARFAPAFPGSTGAFGGPFASLRAWFGFVPGRLVLATRVMGEWLAGDPPFFELVRWGGSMPILGFGGYSTLRGVSFGRWRAPGRAIANAELRIDLFSHKLLKQRLRWQIVPFADMGAVWGAGKPEEGTAMAFPLHPSVGVGAHWIWADAFAARIDAGFAPDPVLEADGGITQEPGWGLYLQFGQTF